LTALPLLARDSELGWLEGDTSDAVVYGQPGSGKTYLLYHFAQRVDGRFLLTRSSDAAVGAVISGCPPVLIVDDAAAEIDLIHRLNHLRRTNGLVFRLIAVCWPFECEDLLSAMELPESRALEVPLLPRAIIAELVQSLIKQAGYEAPNAIVREINNQAVGRPGLAVALTVAALQEDLPAVMRGETLAQTMGRVFESIVGGRAAHIMSAFSVGGKAGMEMEDVAHAIEMPILALHRALRDMAPGGVFEPLSKTRLTATPRAMRRALLKEVFFRPEGVCLPLPIYETLLRAAPDHDEAVITLLESALVGADVDPTWLRTLVADSSAGKVWETYAWLGARQCRDVIENHPHMAQHIVEPALQWVPSLMIPRMLDSAAGDDGPFHGSPDAPLRKLAEWVSHGEAGTPSAVQRRRDLFAATRSWLDAGGEPRTAFLALEPCFRLAYESTDTDPGDGMKVTFSSGLLPLADAEQIAALWPGVLEIARQHGIPNWKPVTAIVSHWLHPRSQFGKSGGDEYTDRTVPVARRMIEEIMPLCGGHNGFLRWVYAHAAEVGLDPSMVPVDREYLALYPVRRPSGDWRAAAEKDSRDAEAVVDSWKDRPLSDVIARLQRYEREAASMEDSWPRLSPHVCRLLAERRGLRDTDILALIAAGVPADLVDAFVVAAIAKGVPVEDVLRECVSQEGYRHLAIYHTLTGSAPHLYPLIRDHLPEHMQQVGRLAYRGNIPVEIMTLLLDHEDRRVRLSAALVEVSSQPGGQVRATVRNAWRKAVVEGLADSERTGDLRHIYDLTFAPLC
jgi:hypothetical protein